MAEIKDEDVKKKDDDKQQRQSEKPPRIEAALQVAQMFNWRMINRMSIEGFREAHNITEVPENTTEEEALRKTANETIRNYLNGEHDFIPPLIPEPPKEGKETPAKRKRKRKRPKARRYRKMKKKKR